MRGYQLRRLPVLDDERRLVGILSLADIVRDVRTPRRKPNELVSAEIADTLAGICEPKDEVTVPAARL
jgi:CBS domain-containing protein